MDGAQVGVLEQVDEERLRALLQGLDRLRLPAQAVAADGDEVERDLADLWYKIESAPERPSQATGVKREGGRERERGSASFGNRGGWGSPGARRAA